jgi:hypothetical protein
VIPISHPRSQSAIRDFNQQSAIQSTIRNSINNPQSQSTIRNLNQQSAIQKSAVINPQSEIVILPTH